MIDTIPFAIGFIIYAGFCIVTFDVYSQKKEITKIFALISIYSFYTLLAGYVISFVDSTANFIEIFIQILFYAITCAIVLYSHYKSVIEKSDLENGYGESPDSKLY